MIIALLLVAFALISWLFKGDINPITGEKQRVSLTVEQEIQLGRQAAPQMIQQHRGKHPDPELQARVTAIGNQLVAAFEKRLASEGRSNPYKFEFHLLSDPDTINAFALPGGQVFITFALFRQLESDGQLAGVLGHEIGHVIERHSAQRMASQELTSILAGAAGVASGDADAARMAQAVSGLINMKYGRDQELESDRWGVELCVLAGYDPRAMRGLMEILDRASSGGRGPEFLSTHPKPVNRIEYIEQIIRDKFPEGLPSGLIP